MIDLIIKNAIIVDGTGKARQPGDIAVEGELIKEVGQIAGVEARQVIDAAGRIVCPGFIDMHSHADFLLPMAPEAESLVHQGITTVVAGQCGVSPAPLTANNRADMVAMIGTLLPPEAPIPWEAFSTFGSYLDYLDGLQTAVNMVPLVGQGSVRSAVMGFRGGRPSEEEVEQMQRLVEEALDCGAFGVSTGLIYAPGSFCSTEELVEVLRPAGRRGGHYFSHIRSEAGGLLSAIQEAIEIGRQTGAPVEISHYKAVSEVNWPKAAQGLALIDQARAEGLDVSADMYPYTAGSTGLESMLPASLLVGGMPALLAQVADPAGREAIIATVKAGGGEITEQIEWDKIMICSARNQPGYVGKRVAELAEAEGKEPEAWVLDALLKTGGDATIVDFLFSEDNLRLQMQHPAMMFGTDGFGLSVSGKLSPGLPHPRSFGAYPRILGHYVRDMQVLSVEQACWKASGLPAQKLGLADRGTIRPGSKADLVVFDPETIADQATFLDPHQYPVGIDWVLVNGQVVVDHDRQMAVRPGKVIRR